MLYGVYRKRLIAGNSYYILKTSTVHHKIVYAAVVDYLWHYQNQYSGVLVKIGISKLSNYFLHTYILKFIPQFIFICNLFNVAVGILE
jgi:hypothetical protein